jgi:DNA mismatch endonuclease (patch repair protein)
VKKAGAKTARSKKLERPRGVPKASSPDALRRMKSQRTKDTAVELALRSALHRMGLRFRVHQRVSPNVRRTVDIAFPKARVAVFVDGCFWHGCPIHGTWPKANADWWREKIEGNRRRDRDTTARLGQAGWTVLRMWEHESVDAAAEAIVDVLTKRRKL